MTFQPASLGLLKRWELADLIDIPTFAVPIDIGMLPLPGTMRALSQPGSKPALDVQPMNLLSAKLAIAVIRN